MKYMLLMFGDQSGMEDWSQDKISEMIRFMHNLNDELGRSGELVDAQGLADAHAAKSIRVRDGVPVVTDGPFAESKESLAGYWLLDCESEDRAVEIASRVVAFTGGPMEVRQIMDAPAIEL